MTGRVAYVLKAFPRLSETFILNEILALRDAGVPVDVFALDRTGERLLHPGARALLDQVTFLDSPPRLRRGPANVPERHRAAAAAGALIAARAGARGVTHLHAHFAGPAATAAAFAARAAGIPFSFTAHAKDIFSRKVDWPWVRRLGREAAAVITVCDYNARFLRDRMSGANVIRIYNGVDLATWSPARRSARRTPRIVAVGRFVRKKGFHVLVDAVAELRARGVPVSVILAGDGREREALECQARHHGLDASRLRFAGSLPQPGVRRLLRSSDLIVLPCVVDRDGNQDALPTVLLEAAACGVPVVSTRVAGVPEIVAHGRTGVLVEPEQPAALASALARLLADPDRRAAMGAAARRRAERRFDLRQASASLAALFRQSAATHSEGSHACRAAVC